MTPLYGSKKSFMKEPKKSSRAQIFFFNPRSMIKHARTDVKAGGAYDTQLPRPVGWHLA